MIGTGILKRLLPWSLLAAACGPSWGPPRGQDPPLGSTRLEPHIFCQELAPYADPNQLAAAADLPHPLPPFHGVPAKQPPRLLEAVREVFAPREYYYLRRESGRGVVGIGKRLTATVGLTASFDVGTWFPSSTATVFLSVDDYYTAFRLPPSTDAATQMQYPLTDRSVWQRLLENYAASMDLLEQGVGGCARQRRAVVERSESAAQQSRSSGPHP